MRVNLEARAANAEQRRAKTRLRLIEAAIGVIAQQGPDQASVEDFVAAAGVSRGTFYNYFPTIDELLHALNDHIGRALDARLATVAEGVRDPAMVLALIAHEIFRLANVEPVRGWVALRVEGASVPRQALVAARFDSIYRWASDKGRFREWDCDAARNLLFGAARLAQAEILAGRAPIDHTVDLIAMVLTAYGLPTPEAQTISRLAWDEVKAKAHYTPVM